MYVLLFFYLHSNTKWKVFEKYMNKYLKYFSMYSYLNTFIFKKYL